MPDENLRGADPCSFWDYVREAFNARPIGMFVPPNWVGLGAFALLGLVNPGFWLIGAGAELAYLATISSNERFRRYVRGALQQQDVRHWQAKVESLVSQLSPEGQRRYKALEVRCRAILEQQYRPMTEAAGLEAQGQGLQRLLWVYLRLLLTRQAIEKIVVESAQGREEADRIEQRIANLTNRLEQETLGDELRKSLAGQIEILQQRLQKRGEARDKLAFLDAELTRIQEQVELVREQAVLSTDPESVSQRIDQITATLGGTTEWIREQQKIYGAVEDLLSEPPPLSATTPARESE